MALSSDSQSSSHSNGPIVSNSTNQANHSPWTCLPRILVDQVEMQDVVPNRNIDTYKSYLQKEPSENSSKFQQALSDFGATCFLEEPTFDPGSSNPMRPSTSHNEDIHPNQSDSSRDNWIDLLDAIPKNIIDTYKSYLQRESSENNFTFLSTADEFGSRRFIDESIFQLNESVDIRESRSVTQEQIQDEGADNHGTEDMEIEDIEEVEMQDVFPNHILNIHQQRELSVDSRIRLGTNAEPEPNCFTNHSRFQLNDSTVSKESSFIGQSQVTPHRNTDVDFENMDELAMMKAFRGYLDSCQQMEESENGFEFPRIITTSAPKCLECERFVSMAGLVPDAPPEDYPLDSDIDVDIGSNSQGWFFLPYMEDLQQSVQDSESRINDTAVQSDESSDNEDYDTFPLCDQSNDADIMQPDSLNIESLGEMCGNSQSEVQADLAELLLTEEIPPPKPEKICGVKPEMSATGDMSDIKTEMVSPEKIPDMKSEISDLKPDFLLTHKLSNLKREMLPLEKVSDIKPELTPPFQSSNFKPERTLIAGKLSSVKPESDLKPEVLSTRKLPNIKPELPSVEAISDREKKLSSEKLSYIKSEMQVKKKPAKELPYLCTECGQRYLVYDQLEQHLWDHIAEMNGKHPFTCLKCPGRRFLNMKLHEQHHRMGLECNVCGQAFHAAIVIAEHKLRVHADKGALKCKVCRKSFSSSTELSRHKKRRHLKTKPYKCKICGKSFEDKEALASHSRHHTSEKETKASQPNSTIQEDSTVRKPSVLKQFTCSQCEDIFTTKHEVDDHLKCSHTNSQAKNLSSDIKDSSCTKSAELESHGRTNASTKTHEIDVETGNLTDKQTQKDHRLTQKEQRSHKCKECSFSSSSSSSLHKHVKKHHKDKIYECKRCDRWYFKKDDLHAHTEKHHKSSHSKEKPQTAGPDSTNKKDESQP